MELEPETPLLWAIRDTVGLTGTKFGCGIQQCGTCTVLIGKRSVRSCGITVGEVAGKEITTIEGFDDDARMAQLRQAFTREHGLQCGFCTPGMITRAHRLLQENPNPTNEEIRWGISGNLCRCTGYQNIVKAIRNAADRINAGREAAE